MVADFEKAGFKQSFEGSTEILTIRPQVTVGPLAAAKTVYEIKDRRVLNIRRGFHWKDDDELQLVNVERIVLRTGPIDQMTDAHDITFKTTGNGEYVWHNVPKAKAVKDFIQSIIAQTAARPNTTSANSSDGTRRRNGSRPEDHAPGSPDHQSVESDHSRYSAYTGALREDCRLSDIRFDPNLHPPPETAEFLAKWHESDAKSKRFPKSESIVIPLPPSHVWRVLLETRDMGHWLHDHKPNQIPNPFGLGALIADRSAFFPNETHYFVVACEPGKRLLFRYDNWDWEAVLEPEGRNGTRLVLTTWSRVPKWAAPIASVFLSRFRREYEEKAALVLFQAVRKFRNLCYDHAYFGGALRSNSDVHVVTAPYDGSVVRFFPDQNGKPLSVGDRVGSVRLGYFHPADAADHEQYRNRWYFDTNPGIVEIMFKKDGDRVDLGDRVVLIHREQADSAYERSPGYRSEQHSTDAEEARLRWKLPLGFTKQQVIAAYDDRIHVVHRDRAEQLNRDYEILMQAAS